MNRLTAYDANTITSMIEGRIKVEKYIERKKGKVVSKWDIRP